MKPEKPLLAHRDPDAQPRSHSSKLLLLLAVIILGSLAFMIFRRAVTPNPPNSASPVPTQKTSP